MKKIFLGLLIMISAITLTCCKSDGLIKIGILQYVSHEDLDDARIGFIKALEENGFRDNVNIKLTILNPQADNNVMQLQAKNLVRSNDIILAIATPAALAIVNEVKEQGKNTKVLFTAVTDPVDAKLVKSLENHGSNITGTSDLTPIDRQIELVKELKKDAKKIGIIYTASETNSKAQADIASREAQKLGLSAITKTISTIGDLAPIFNSLVVNDKVDAIYIPSDNLLSSNIGQLNELNIAKASYQVPIIASTTFQVREGAGITLGLSYKNLGIQTGLMAVDILNGKDIKEIDVEMIEKLELAINKTSLIEILKLEIDALLLDRADIIFE